MRDVGQLFARAGRAAALAAALMGIMGKGMGYDRVVWGTDAVWTGSPQWQIEALRRLEIPEDMQKKYGFKPLGAADGPIKTAIFGGTNAQLYNIDPQAHRSRPEQRPLRAMKEANTRRTGRRAATCATAM